MKRRIKRLIKGIRTLERGVKIALAASLSTGVAIWMAAAAAHLTTGWFPHWLEAVALIAVTASLGTSRRSLPRHRGATTLDDRTRSGSKHRLHKALTLAPGPASRRISTRPNGSCATRRY